MRALVITGESGPEVLRVEERAVPGMSRRPLRTLALLFASLTSAGLGLPASVGIHRSLAVAFIRLAIPVAFRPSPLPLFVGEPWIPGPVPAIAAILIGGAILVRLVLRE